VVTTQLGGNTGKAKIKFSLVPAVPPTPTSGIFTHIFDYGVGILNTLPGDAVRIRVASTTYINFNGAIADAQIVGPSVPPSGIDRFGNSRKNYFVIITMNDLYSSITVKLLQAPAGAEDLLLTKIENMGGGRRWGVWFNLPNAVLPVGQSFFAIKWSVTAGPLGIPPNPGRAYPAAQSWSRTAVNRRLPG